MRLPFAGRFELPPRIGVLFSRIRQATPGCVSRASLSARILDFRRMTVNPNTDTPSPTQSSWSECTRQPAIVRDIGPKRHREVATKLASVASASQLPHR